MKKRNENKINNIIEDIKNEINDIGLEIIPIKNQDTIKSYGLMYPSMTKPKKCECIISITDNFNIILDRISLDMETLLDFEYILKNIEGVRNLYVSMPKENFKDFMMNTHHICKPVDSRNNIKEILNSTNVEYDDVNYKLIEIVVTMYDGYTYSADMERIEGSIEDKAHIMFKCIQKNLIGLPEDVLTHIRKDYYIKRDGSKIFPREHEVVCCRRDKLDNRDKYVIHDSIIGPDGDKHIIRFGWRSL